MSTSDLLTCLERLGQPRVLVLGDFILDRYTWGDAERVSQEAPVILLRADHREARLGGAGNVAAMLRGLDAQVTCAGIVGDDLDGRQVRELLTSCGANADLLLADATRPTTVKERFIGRAQGRHPHQILRVDSEVRAPIGAALEAQFAQRLATLIGQHDVVLISDYDKGVCTPALLRKVIDRCRELDVPVLVDPIRGHDYSRYRGATSMTPNRTEAGQATGLTIDSRTAALEAAERLKTSLGLDFSIVTLDRDGMALVDRGGDGEIYPTKPRAVYDITGAGDMVLAMIGVCVAAGLAPADCVRLGNVAGGLEVEKVGVAVIPRAEIRTRLLADRPLQLGKVVEPDALLALATAHRASGERIALVRGTFATFDLAQVRALEAAASSADVLVVAVDGSSAGGNATISMLGAAADERASLLAALACVRYVVSLPAGVEQQFLSQLQPDVLASSSESSSARHTPGRKAA
ncbi:MAG: bifunctional heptose 7-phosphate kinase/heptose 1-phosphate adenyltransferase [Planctomycetes bacterium]|nr:bifunctional heptose 7-phosphate kinase/heptose 1-phosphate adenyltransferase [Planctomycetota bacterium]